MQNCAINSAQALTVGIGVYDYIFLEATVLSISTTCFRNYMNVFTTDNKYLNQGKLFPHPSKIILSFY